MADQDISNLIAVLFTLALIYAGQLLMCVLRTRKGLCSRQDGDHPEFKKIYIAFYVCLQISLAMSISLYILLCVQDLHQNGWSQKAGVIVFYFIPTILMVICYIMLYYQLERLMVESRIQSSDLSRFQGRASTRIANCAKVMKVLFWVMIVLFLATQGLLMFLALFGWIDLNVFFFEISGFTAAIVLGLNLYLIVSYLKMAGQPYKTQKSFEAVRWIGMTAGIWTIGFVIKFFVVIFGNSLYQASELTTSRVAVFQACVVSLCDYCSVIVPIFLVTDTYFVKVFSGAHLTPKLGDNEDIRVTQLMLDTSDNPEQTEADKQQHDTVQTPKILVSDELKSPSISRSHLLTSAALGKYIIDTPYLQENKVEAYRHAIEKKIMIQAEDFELKEAFTRAWYPNNEKVLKNKLGRLQLCQYKGKPHVCRVMNFKRITAYQLDQYFLQLTHLHMLKMAVKFVSTPVGIFIDEENCIHLISPERISLYELLHSQDPAQRQKLSTFTKLSILTQLAKILNTFHSFKHKTWAHGSLTPHNVFVSVPEDAKQIERELKVQIEGIELTDLKKYANKFYSYRPVSVWSPPEVLKHPKKLDEPSPPMDVYSFGMLAWEIFHEEVPFDNSVSDCTDYVCNQDARPQIQDIGEEDDDEEEAPKLTCTLPMSNLIRKCWVKDPGQRPDFNKVIEDLTKELGYYKQSDEGGLNNISINDTDSD